MHFGCYIKEEMEAELRRFKGLPEPPKKPGRPKKKICEEFSMVVPEAEPYLRFMRKCTNDQRAAFVRESLRMGWQMLQSSLRIEHVRKAIPDIEDDLSDLLEEAEERERERAERIAAGEEVPAPIDDDDDLFV